MAPRIAGMKVLTRRSRRADRPAARDAAAPGRSEPDLAGVRANDHGVEDRIDLVGREIGALRVLADRGDVDCLVDADGPDPAIILLDDIAADPSHPVRHLFIADLGRARGGLFEIRNVGEGTATAYGIQLHCWFPSADEHDCLRIGAVYRTAESPEW